MGKYDYICELTDTENYSQWRRRMTLALQGERLWSHCSTGTDPANLSDFASTKPAPKDSLAVTDSEKEKILDWLAKDAQAKALIDREISSVVANLLDKSQTAREQWDLLRQHYSHNDLLSQYELRTRVRTEKLKDADDIARYIGVFEDVRRRFLQMGVTYTTEESIFDLLQGLPTGVEWDIFRELALSKLSTSSRTSTSTTTKTATTTITRPPPNFTFDDAIKLLSLHTASWHRRR